MLNRLSYLAWSIPEPQRQPKRAAWLSENRNGVSRPERPATDGGRPNGKNWERYTSVNNQMLTAQVVFLVDRGTCTAPPIFSTKSATVTANRSPKSTDSTAILRTSTTKLLPQAIPATLGCLKQNSHLFDHHHSSTSNKTLVSAIWQQ
jgi:hypothetical protein